MRKKGLRIVTTSDCNNNCIFCIFKEIRVQKNSLTLPRAKFVMKYYKEKCGFDNVFFTGGEPTLYKGLEDLIAYAFQIGYEDVLIGSNGMNFADLNYCKKIMSLGKCKFAISFTSLDYIIDNFLCQNDEHYFKTIKALYNLKSLGAHVLVRIIITKRNYKGLLELCVFLKKIGIDKVQFQFYCLPKNEINLQKKELIVKLTDLKPFLKQALLFCIENKQDFDLLNFPFCFLEEFNKYNADREKPMQAISFDGINFVDCIEQVNSFKIKKAACKDCAYRSLCDGIWEYYVDCFGCEEFK